MPKRFTEVKRIDKYIIYKDNYNDMYGVFIQARGFVQQASKWYLTIKWAERFCAKH